MFDSFIILAGMRTGSNFLEANLNAMTGIASHGELFNPHFIGKKDRVEWLGYDLARRAADPMAFWHHVQSQGSQLAGFRFFEDHDPRVFDAMVADPRCAKIILTRNPLETFVSLGIARTTGQWKMTNAKMLKPGTMTFDGAAFQAHLAEVQAFHLRIRRALQTSGQTAFHIDYEDLFDLDVLNGLAAFLVVAGRLEQLDPKLKKQNPGDLSAKVDNPDQMEQALSALDPFGLSRTPVFEPARAPMVPGFIASSGAGLLFMPVRGAPTDRVQDWLSQLGAGGTETGFSQKNLRQWKKRWSAPLAFTVLQHPVVRAFDAYLAIQHGDLPDLRRLMVQGHDLPIPNPDAPADAQQSGFLAFVRFAGMTLAGQTGLRVPPHWATQTACVDAMSQVQPPDLILREDRLPQGLAYLAAEVGIYPAPAFAAVTGPEMLEAIYDAQIEQAVQMAYKRDYQGFGFAPWRPA